MQSASGLLISRSADQNLEIQRASQRSDRLWSKIQYLYTRKLFLSELAAQFV